MSGTPEDTARITEQEPFFLPEPVALEADDANENTQSQYSREKSTDTFFSSPRSTSMQSKSYSIMSQLENATCEAVCLGNIEVLAFLLGVDQEIINNPELLADYRSQQGPKKLYDLARAYIKGSEQVTDSYVIDAFAELYLAALEKEQEVFCGERKKAQLDKARGPAKYRTKKGAELLTEQQWHERQRDTQAAIGKTLDSYIASRAFTQHRDEFRKIKDLGFTSVEGSAEKALNRDREGYWVQLDKIKQALESAQAAVLDSCQEEVSRLLAVGGSLVVGETRMSVQELQKTGVFSLWLEYTAQMVEAFFQESLAFLDQLKNATGLDRDVLLAKVQEWNAQRQTKETQVRALIKQKGEDRNDLTNRLYDSTVNATQSLAVREKHYQNLADRASQQKLIRANARGWWSKRIPLHNQIPDLFASNHSEIMLNMLSARVPVDTCVKQANGVPNTVAGDTLLHIAIKHDQVAAARLLITLGANPFLVNAESQSALSLACRANRGAFLAMLVEANALDKLANANSENHITNKALFKAIQDRLVAYTKLYSKRLSSKCHLSMHIKQRGEQLARYWDYLQLAKDHNNPTIIIAIIRHDAAEAPKGCLKKSKLNDGLMHAIANVQNQYQSVGALPQFNEQLKQWKIKLKENIDHNGVIAWFYQAQASYDLALPPVKVVKELKRAVKTLSPKHAVSKQPKSADTDLALWRQVAEAATPISPMLANPTDITASSSEPLIAIQDSDYGLEACCTPSTGLSHGLKSTMSLTALSGQIVAAYKTHLQSLVSGFVQGLEPGSSLVAVSST